MVEWGTPTIGPGALVEFHQDKRILCGLCLKADKKTLHLLSEENREVALPPPRALTAVGGFMNPSDLREEVVARLRQESARREEIKNEISISDLWELLAGENCQYTIEELARIYFGDSASPQHISGLMRALKDDRVFFERKADLYVPNSAERTQQLLEAIRAEQAKAREREEMARWLQSLWLGGKPATSPSCLPKYLEWFRDFAIMGMDSSRAKEVQSILAKGGIQQRDAAFQVLVKAGVWDVDENLLIHKNRVPVEFPAAVLAEAEAILAQPAALGEHRRDLTHLHTMTIDDEHTVETDDAISLEPLADGVFRIGVHIADPAHVVAMGGVLDREALHRGTSIYFPEQKIPMLPPLLGAGACSLKLDETRPAVSILAEVNTQGVLLAVEIVESIIKVAEKLTYDIVDDTLERRPDLGKLRDLAMAMREARRLAGAFFVPFPTVEVHVDADRHIDIRREEHELLESHIIVSECMILANQSVARFCIDNKLPAIYRGQPPPSEPIDIQGEFTPLHGFRVRRLLRKGGTSLDPVRHSGLGLDAYVQFTSPIRRYVDLIMHRQVKHYLREGVALFTTAELEKLLVQITGSVELAESMERTRKQYWILRYLEENRWEVRDAAVLQVFPDRWHVQLIETLVETDCPGVSGMFVQPGQVIGVKIELVFPREGVLRVSAEAPAGVGATVRGQRAPR